MEKSLYNYLSNSINFPFIKFLTEKERTLYGDRRSREMKGVAIYLSKNLFPELDKISQEIKEKLDIKDEIEVYITNSAETNAFSIYKENKEAKHIIGLHSSVIERFSHEELKFIIGHELGHILLQHQSLSEAIKFVFPDPSSMPSYFQLFYILWRQLSEISADFVGLIVTESPDVAIKTLFKLHLGVSNENIEMNKIKNYVDKIYEKYDSFFNRDTHPPLPLRLKILIAFSESKLFSSLKHGETDLKKANASLKKLEEIALKLTKFPENGFESAYVAFIINAGLLIAACDKEITKDEMEQIVSLVSYFIDPLLCKELTDINQITQEKLEKPAKFLSENFPETLDAVFQDLILVSLADRRLKDEEVEMLFLIGEKMLNLPIDRIISIFRRTLQRYFKPGFYI